MASHKNSIRSYHPNALLAGKSHSIHVLDEEDAARALQTSFLLGASRRRNPTQLIEAFACDDFRMYEYKVRRCMRGRSHDWTDCPFAHPGEKARRRDPRKIHYSGSPCPDFRKGSCWRGDACEYAHGVFECWLHPARYRTQVCKDGRGCTRRVCFFAHSTEQLRHVAVPVEESPTDWHSMVDSHIHAHDLGSPLHRALLEDSSHECKLGSSSQTDSSDECRASPANSPCGADSNVGLSSQAEYCHVRPISKMFSMLTFSSQNVLSSPLEAVSTMGFSSNNPMGVGLDMVSMVHPPSPNLPSVGSPGSSVAFSEKGATSQDDSFTFERPSVPAVVSPVSNLQQYTGGLSSSKCHTTGEYSSYAGGSPLHQAAAWPTFPIHKGCSGGGQASFSANADSDMVYYGGYGDEAMQQGYLNAIGRGIHGVNEVANELYGASKSTSLTDQLALLRKDSSYNAYGSYGLPSPTSTLAGPFHSPRFSSPPLSPLSTPSSEATNLFSSRGHGNGHVDDTSPTADVHIQNRHFVKELEFTHNQQSLHSHYHSRHLGDGKVNTALTPCLELPSFSQRTCGQNKCCPPCNNWNSEDTYNCNVLQQPKFDMQHKICGRFGGESPAENAIPDLGWVAELVM